MLNQIVLTTAVSFILTAKCLHSQKAYAVTQDKAYRRNTEHKIGIENSSEARSEESLVSNTSGLSNQFRVYVDNHVSRHIRSVMSPTFNGTTGIERPNPKLTRNKTSSSKTGKEQVHVFFLSKAREDAYQKTEAKEHPYSVVMRIRSEDFSVHICSGTLVTARWVLTAAHCLVDNEAVTLEVYAGIAFNIFDENIPKKLPKGAQVKITREFYVNPKYDRFARNVDYDVALVEFDPAFRITEYVQPVRMTSTPWSHRGYRKCELTAFGRVLGERDSPDDFIRKTQELEVRKPCDCDRQLEAVQGKAAASRYICMKPTQDFGFCVGDSGGGLICDGELKAVVSFSLRVSELVGCQVNAQTRRSADVICGDLDTLNIYQDVYDSLSWIKKNALPVNVSGVQGANKANGRDLNFHNLLCSVLFGLPLLLQ